MKAAQAAPELLEAFLTTVGRQGLQPEHCKAFKWTAALPVRLRVSRLELSYVLMHRNEHRNEHRSQ